ncbi:hypothetical protein ANN_18477 [Periplaneta americana]|uniref:Uncharacterized protein n=1 Tax=Periplaneta americana TaxID=6978 RepID=A0ABQ8SPI5_PERAM|nr:hypothetical protein ANN_18477 [Periplaneta americana]
MLQFFDVFVMQFDEKDPICGTDNWVLHHDNTPAHRSLLVSKFLEQHKIPVLSQPSYSPDLAPADFYLFPKVKSLLKEQRFAKRCTEELRNVVKNLLFVAVFASGVIQPVKSPDFTTLKSNLDFIEHNFPVVPKTIKLLEASNEEMPAVLKLIEEMTRVIDQASSTPASNRVKHKLNSVLCKTLDMLYSVTKDMLAGRKSADTAGKKMVSIT